MYEKRWSLSQERKTTVFHFFGNTLALVLAATTINKKSLPFPLTNSSSIIKCLGLIVILTAATGKTEKISKRNSFQNPKPQTQIRPPSPLLSGINTMLRRCPYPLALPVAVFGWEITAIGCPTEELHLLPIAILSVTCHKMRPSPSGSALKKEDWIQWNHRESLISWTESCPACSSSAPENSGNRVFFNCYFKGFFFFFCLMLLPFSQKMSFLFVFLFLLSGRRHFFASISK